MKGRPAKPLANWQQWIGADWPYGVYGVDDEAALRGTTVTDVSVESVGDVALDITTTLANAGEWEGTISGDRVGAGMVELEFTFANGDRFPCYFNVNIKTPKNYVNRR